MISDMTGFGRIQSCSHFDSSHRGPVHDDMILVNDIAFVCHVFGVNVSVYLECKSRVRSIFLKGHTRAGDAETEFTAVGKL